MRQFTTTMRRIDHITQIFKKAKDQILAQWGSYGSCGSVGMWGEGKRESIWGVRTQGDSYMEAATKRDTFHERPRNKLVLTRSHVTGEAACPKTTTRLRWPQRRNSSRYRTRVFHLAMHAGNRNLNVSSHGMHHTNRTCAWVLLFWHSSCIQNWLQ